MYSGVNKCRKFLPLLICQSFKEESGYFIPKLISRHVQSLPILMDAWKAFGVLCTAWQAQEQPGQQGPALFSSLTLKQVWQPRELTPTFLVLSVRHQVLQELLSQVQVLQDQSFRSQICFKGMTFFKKAPKLLNTYLTHISFPFMLSVGFGASWTYPLIFSRWVTSRTYLGTSMGAGRKDAFSLQHLIKLVHNSHSSTRGAFRQNILLLSHFVYLYLYTCYDIACFNLIVLILSINFIKDEIRVKLKSGALRVWLKLRRETLQM